jgi:chromosome segregation ATPase
MTEDELHERMAVIEDQLDEIEKRIESILEEAGSYYDSEIGETRVNGYDTEDLIDELENEATMLRGELVALNIDPAGVEGRC